MNVLLSTAYWPNLEYFFYLLNSRSVSIELHENFTRQTYRNRCRILSANGPLDLIIPVRKTGTRMAIDETFISYDTDWQRNHWHAIISAYRNSPYFEFFGEAIRPFYSRRFESLTEFNSLQLKTIFRILKIENEISFTKSFEKSPVGVTDLRETIHPKNNTVTSIAEPILQKPYYQTFQEKFPFIANLSILDLLFNTGLQSTDYLRLK
jgi:hypothetical protein